MATNPTVEKFGFRGTLLREFIDEGSPGAPSLASTPQLSSQGLAGLAGDLAARFC